MSFGIVSTEAGASKVVIVGFSALADRLSPSVQRVRKEIANIGFRRVTGTIWAAESGCVVTGSAPLQSLRSILSTMRKLRGDLVCCRRDCGGWTHNRWRW